MMTQKDRADIVLRFYDCLSDHDKQLVEELQHIKGQPQHIKGERKLARQALSDMAEEYGYGRWVARYLWTLGHSPSKPSNAPQCP